MISTGLYDMGRVMKWSSHSMVSLIRTSIRGIENLIEKKLTTPPGAASATSNANCAGC